MQDDGGQSEPNIVGRHLDGIPVKEGVDPEVVDMVDNHGVYLEKKNKNKNRFSAPAQNPKKEKIPLTENVKPLHGDDEDPVHWVKLDAAEAELEDDDNKIQAMQAASEKLVGSYNIIE